MDKNRTIRKALLTMSAEDIDRYAGQAWREAVLDNRVMLCGHHPQWWTEDAEGFSFCAMCKCLGEMG